MTDRLNELFRPVEIEDAIRDELRTILLLNGGVLKEEQAKAVAIHAGVHWVTVYRWAARILADLSLPVESSESETFLERIERMGQKGFVMDDTFWALYYAADGNMYRLRKEIVEDLELPMPSLPTLSRRLHEFPILERKAAREGLDKRFKRLIIIRQPDGKPMECFEVDEFVLDLWVKPKRGKKLVKPHALLLIEHSARPVVSFLFLPHAVRAVDYQLALGMAFEDYGPCEYVNFDNAGCFTAPSVMGALSGFPVGMRPCPAYTPIAKARVERAGQTIQSKFIYSLCGRNTTALDIDEHDMLGGSTEYALSWDKAETLFTEAVEEYNNEVWDHFGRSRLEQLKATKPEPRHLPDKVLANLYQPAERGSGIRTMQPDGVLVKPLNGGKSVYWVGPCREFIDPGIDVQVRVRPGSHRAAVMYDGKFQGWVWETGHLPDDEEKAIRHANGAVTARVRDHAAGARATSEAGNARIEAGGSRSPVAVAVADPDIVPDAIRERRKRAEDRATRTGRRPDNIRRNGRTENLTGAAASSGGLSTEVRAAGLGINLHPEDAEEGFECEEEVVAW